MAAVNEMNYTNEGKNPLLVFEKARGGKVEESSFWFKLGLMLYDSGYDQESLASFEHVTAFEKSGLIAPNHSPRFAPDEGAMITGVRALASVAVDYLGGNR